jgi:general secretion pathway protein I
MKPRAFTLIEVLIALAVFAMAAVVLGAAYINVLNAYSGVAASAQRDEDLRFARQAVLIEPDLKKVEEGGDFETVDGRRVRWRTQVEPTNVADLFSVMLTVETGETAEATGGRDRNRRGEIRQNFLLLRPTWSEAAERDKLRQEAADRIRRYQALLQ